MADMLDFNSLVQFHKLQSGEELTYVTIVFTVILGILGYRIISRYKTSNWRVVYRIDTDAIVILEVFQKKTQATPKYVIDNCKRRIKQYDS